MDNIVNQIHHLLIKKKKNIAVAESCTGGLASYLLTQTAGSSNYFVLGVVAYSNQAKHTVLKISPSLIVKKGAVSEEVAQKMATNIRRLAKTDIGIGITGIAGPTGGTFQKPIGTVFIAIDTKNCSISKRFIFKGKRISIRKKTALKSLELLNSLITKSPLER